MRISSNRLLAVIAGLATAVAATRAAQNRPAPAAARTPTFAADIAPIVYANCVTCHRPGQAAPFSLLTYEDVRKHGEDIADVTSSRYMPPWHASKAEGFPEFQDERHLSDEAIATFQRWVDAGMPSGDLKRAPSPPVFPSGWTLGPPDLVLPIARPIEVPAEGPDIYRNVSLAIDLPEDRWITAIDYKPSARRVVHHALYFTGPSDVPVADDEAVPGLAGLARLRALIAARQGAPPPPPSSGGEVAAAADAWGGLGGWVPGVTPRFFPDGIAQPLPKHTNLIAQLHLHPTGKVESEHGQLAVYFAKTPPKRSLTGVQVPPAFGIGMGIDIPANEPHYVIRDSYVLPVDVDAYGARGHAHYLGKEMRMTATLPDGTTRGVLLIKDWDFSWQDSYYFKTPFKLPKGTKLDTEIVYDNSVDNSRNPNYPPQRVRWGRESFDEMGSMTLLVTTDDAAGAQALRLGQSQHLREQLLRRPR
jgi:mono/diheme cytochrome c family protein